MLAWQTRELQRLAVACAAYTVYVRPRLVAGIAFNNIQASSHYPGGPALRFARIKTYRPDTRPEEVDDTIETLSSLY